MATAIRRSLAARRTGRYFAFALPRPSAGLEGDRLTRVPFLKLCVEGSFEVVGSPSAISPGDMALFHPGTFANVRYANPCRVLRITFDPDNWLVGEETIAATPSYPRKRALPAGALRACLLPAPRDVIVTGLLSQLLHGSKPDAQASFDSGRVIWQRIADSLDEPPQKPSQPALARSRRDAIRFILDQCHHPLNRREAAKALGISDGHLGRILRWETGQSFAQFLRAARLEQARGLLRHSQLTIEEVALRSGFSSANYFAQVFRGAEGLSPRAWQQRLSESGRSRDD